MVGSLSRILMKRAINFAGDGTKPVTLTILESTSYDPETGETTRSDSNYSLGRAIVGVVSEGEVAKHRLTATTHKAVVAMLDYEASGSPQLPKTSDTILLDTKPWLVDKVVFGSMNQSVIFYVSEA